MLERGVYKVEKIFKRQPGLDPITFSENSNFEQESLLEVWRQNIDGHCQQTFENKKFVDITQQCFALLHQVNFPANNLNFHWKWRWWDRIRAIFLNIFYFNHYLGSFSIKKSMYKSPLFVGNVHSIPFFNFHSEGFQDKIFDKIQPFIRRHCRFVNIKFPAIHFD